MINCIKTRPVKSNQWLCDSIRAERTTLLLHSECVVELQDDILLFFEDETTRALRRDLLFFEDKEPEYTRLLVLQTNVSCRHFRDIE